MSHMNTVAQGLIDMAKRIESLDTENADLRARLAEMTAERNAAFAGLEAANLLNDIVTKARDEQAEAVKIIAHRYWSCVSDQAVCHSAHVWADYIPDDIKNNPTAAAAVKEASK